MTAECARVFPRHALAAAPLFISEILYSFASAANNSSGAIAAISANTVFYTMALWTRDVARPALADHRSAGGRGLARGEAANPGRGRHDPDATGAGAVLEPTDIIGTVQASIYNDRMITREVGCASARMPQRPSGRRS